MIYADPTNKPARELQASALEQLGYQAESATWRNAYLQGAWELRNGMPNINTAVSTLSKDTLQALSLDLFFDFLGVRLNPLKVAGKFTVINWHFTDSDTKKVMRLENSTLTHTSGFHDENANITLSLTRETLDAIILKELGMPMAMLTGKVKVSGNPLRLQEVFGALDDFSPKFNVIEPLSKP